MQMSQEPGDHDIWVEMNTTPLIDVMLVLLVMLIITIPVQTHAIKLALTKSPSHEQLAPPEVVRIQIKADGTVLWNEELVGDQQALESKLRQVAAMANPPEVHLRPHRLARYEHVAKVMAQVQRLGVQKLGIVGHEQFAL